MTPYRVGIVGVGKLGSFHCNALANMPEAKLVGVYDTDEAQCTAVAEKFNCTACSSEDELIRSADVIGVAVPTSTHLAAVRNALQHGRPVFVEKPIAGTIAEAQEIVDLAAAKKIPVQVGHIERFNPAIRALDSFELKPLFIESHRLAPFDPRGTDVAVILDLMIHDIDIILTLVSSPVSAIHANGVAIVSDEADIANARIEFDNGSVANVTASRISQRKMRKMRLFQNDAYISIDFLQKLTEIFRLAEQDEQATAAIHLGQIDKGKYRRNILYERPPVPAEDAMQAEWKSFFNALTAKTTPVVSAADGLRALTVAMRIREKIAGAAGQNRAR
ncbi:Gfo/Idh/MocA family oxidoreductase [candidate division KSB1 bacterium]|nr:Gfo/Idh/MocA family oxidoreductase [candidate division KSB1 bacterium]RQW09264.1 MAG: gfo/Idh/MocA family oxidoreductase [candidate division KSB1 bacterium]